MLIRRPKRTKAAKGTVRQTVDQKEQQEEEQTTPSTGSDSWTQCGLYLDCTEGARTCALGPQITTRCLRSDKPLTTVPQAQGVAPAYTVQRGGGSILDAIKHCRQWKVKKVQVEVLD